MELLDYKTKMKILEDSFNKAKKDLAIEYAISNNPYKVGDIIADSSTCIKIQKIVTMLRYDNPFCVYEGAVLKKDLTPKKNRERSSVFQSQIVLTFAKDK